MSKETRTCTKDIPIEHAHGSLRVLLVREAHRAEASRPAVRTQRNIRAGHGSCLPEEILQVLPLYMEGQLP